MKQKDWAKEVEYQLFKAFMLNAGGTRDYKKYSRKIIKLVKKELSSVRKEAYKVGYEDGVNRLP